MSAAAYRCPRCGAKHDEPHGLVAHLVENAACFAKARAMLYDAGARKAYFELTAAIDAERRRRRLA